MKAKPAAPVPPVPVVLRLRLCAAPGCKRLSLHSRCDHHREPPRYQMMFVGK